MPTSTKSQALNPHLGNVIIAGWTDDGEVIQEHVTNAKSLWRCFEIHLQGGTINAVIPLTGLSDTK